MHRSFRGVWAWCCLLSAAVAAGMAGCGTPPGPAPGLAKKEAGTVAIRSAQASLAVEEPTGQVVSVRVGPGAGEEMARPGGLNRERATAHVEVVDLRGRRTYSPFFAESTVTDWQADPGGNSVSFSRRYPGAPFALRERIAAAPEGVRWDVTLRLLPGERDNRSVQVCWMFPLPRGWRFWTPNTLEPVATNGVTPYRAVYGHAYYQAYGTILPLAGVWGSRGGAAVFSPPDVVKTQILFDVYTQRSNVSGRGQGQFVEDAQWLRVSHTLIGLRPGKDLSLSLCLAGARPDWRGVLGHYVGAYPDLFEPVPQTRKWEGMYGITGAQRTRLEDFATFKPRGVTMLELHGSFPEYGVYVTPEAMQSPLTTYPCKPHPGGEVSLDNNRRIIQRLNADGVGTFLYFYNVHANSDTIARRFAEDLVGSEAGRPIIQYQGEPALRAQPDSPFGRHLIEQLDLMLKAYPDVPGFFVDNFSIQMLDFAHDDGVTMVHDRPAYSLNRNHQTVGPICFQKAHRAGRMIMVNKLSSIESARGADVVLAESNNTAYLLQLALACVYRPLYPLGWRFREGTQDAVERSVQHLMVLGCLPDLGLSQLDEQTVRQYRLLTDALIGKRWVFDRDPVTIPEGYDGQIFRIDPNAPRGGDVVVVLTSPTKTWKKPDSTEGLAVKVRLPEADRFTSATFLPVEASSAPPVACKFTRAGEEVTVPLPGAGAAGVLRLSR